MTNIYSLPQIITSICIFIASLAILTANPRRLLNHLFFLAWGVGITVGVLGSLAITLNSHSLPITITWIRRFEIFRAILPALLIHLNIIFYNVPWRHVFLVPAYLSMTAAIAVSSNPQYITQLGPGPYGPFLQTGSLYTFFHLLPLAIALITFLIFSGANYRKNKAKLLPSTKKKTLLYWSISFIFAAFGLLIDYPATLGFPLYPAGAFFYFLSLSFAIPAISQYQSLDSYSIIKKSLVYFFLITILSSSYLVMVLLIETLFSSVTLGYQVLITTFLFVGIVVIIFNPLKETIQILLDKLFYRKEHHYQEVTHHFGQVVSNIPDLPELGNRLTSTIVETLGPESTSLCVLDQSKNELICLAASGKLISPFIGKGFKLQGNNWGRADLEEISLVWTFNPTLLKNKRLQETHFVPQTKQRKKEPYKVLSLPLYQNNKLLGVFHLGPKLSGDDYSSQDIQLVHALTSYTSVAIQKILEESEREKVIQLFGRYVPPQVVDQILTSSEEEAFHVGGRRREITVLFADIRGFTKMSDKMQPEEVVAILNRYLSKMTEIIFQYEGTLDKYIGDGIMAIFNAPLEQEDHALRAVRVAWQMQTQIEEINSNLGYNNSQAPGYGIGINTGIAVAGNIGSDQRLEYTVVGDTVNLASRLEERASKGKILITASTFKEVKNMVKARVLRPMKIKGKADPVTAYEILDCRT